MTELLKTAMAEASRLPEAAQDEIGRELLTYIEQLRWLRAEIDKGISSLDAGEGRELEIDEFLRELHDRHGSPTGANDGS
jgi:Arc/MetJ-type ribon-helix-helix transcriptional regulator